MNATSLAYGSLRKGLARLARWGVIAATLAGCGSTADDSASSDQHFTSAPGTDAAPHSPAVGSAERTAFMNGVRKVFDAEIRSTPAPGQNDVEFVVDPGPGTFLVGSRNGVTWGFLAATAQDPSTHKPFDYSHAPPDIQEMVKDENGHPDPHIIAIMQLKNGAWIEAVGTGATDPGGFFLAPGDVSWQDWPCKANAPFGVLLGAAASPAECGGGAPANPQCKQDTLTKVPDADVDQLVQDFVDMSDAQLVTLKLQADGTYTVTSTAGCAAPPPADSCNGNSVAGLPSSGVAAMLKDARQLDGSDTIMVSKAANGTYGITTESCN